MKNKFIKLSTMLLTLVTVVCFSFACTSDNGEDGNNNGDIPEHVHEYAFKYDENNHWEECICGDVKNPAAHILVLEKCDCGYKEDTPVVAPSITFEDFIDDHIGTAETFADTYVRGLLLEDREALSETWAYSANNQDEMDSISLTYTYAKDDTTRVIEVATATFAIPVDLDKIVDGSVELIETASVITRTTAFEFDAKEAYQESDVAQAIFGKVGSQDTTKYYKELESTRNNIREFQIAEQTDDALNIYNVSIVGTTDEEIIENLAYSYNYEVDQHATYTLGDADSHVVVDEVYVQEEFAPENVDEIVQEFSSELKTALDANFASKVGSETNVRGFDANKMTDIVWDIGSGETISEIKMIYTYETSATSHKYVIAKITFANPINIRELNADNINSKIAAQVDLSTISSEYTFAYNPTIQGTRDGLANAIFEANGMENECPEGATRYFVDNGTTLDSQLNEAHKYTVVQITESGVEEITIIIKSSDSDEEYIEKLANSENYRISNTKSVSLNGEKLGIESDAPAPQSENEDEEEASI